MTETILRLATFETLITILTIENLTSDYDSNFDLTIKSDIGQHLQFLRFLKNQVANHHTFHH